MATKRKKATAITFADFMSKTDVPQHQKSYASGSLTLCDLPTKENITFSKKKKFMRTIIVLSITGIITLIIYALLENFGLLSHFSSLDSIRTFILSAGVWSYVVFFFLQFFQVTFLPVPSMLTTLAGALIFGPVGAFLVSAAGIILGSIVAFFIGRKFGVKLINWIAGPHDAAKFRGRMSRCKYLFCLMLLFPFSPDDLLCLIAGTTTMSFRFFIVSVAVFRTISICLLCFFGSGAIIPFTAWSIPIWAVLVIAMGVLFVLSIKYPQKIEDGLVKILNKLKTKK